MTDFSINRDLELFLTRDRIQQRVHEMGAEISRDFAGQRLVLIGVLKGAAIFLVDLARAITVDCTFDFVSISSYGADAHSCGVARLVKDVDQSIENRIVLLVEDILGTGITALYLRKLFLARQPATLKIVTLLDKPSRRVQEIAADTVGFTIPNRFVVGYGMDIAERYRNLPDIYFVPPDIQVE